MPGLEFLYRKLPKKQEDLAEVVLDTRPKIILAYDEHILKGYNIITELKYGLKDKLDSYWAMRRARLWRNNLNDFQKTTSYNQLCEYLRKTLLYSGHVSPIVSRLMSHREQKRGQRKKRLYAARRVFIESTDVYYIQTIRERPVEAATSIMISSFYLLERMLVQACKKTRKRK